LDNIDVNYTITGIDWRDRHKESKTRSKRCRSSQTPRQESNLHCRIEIEEFDPDKSCSCAGTRTKTGLSGTETIGIYHVGVKRCRRKLRDLNKGPGGRRPFRANDLIAFFSQGINP
jgi:hypothetical protein